MIETEYLEVKLLNGTIIKVRPLTLKERRHCISLIPSNLTDDPAKFPELYLDFQKKVIHYIITRTTPNFKESDVDNLLDASLMSKIINFALKDPFKEFFGW